MRRRVIWTCWRCRRLVYPGEFVRLRDRAAGVDRKVCMACRDAAEVLLSPIIEGGEAGRKNH